MKISAINFNNNFKIQTKIPQKVAKNQTFYPPLQTYPINASQFLAFMGGYSVNLKETYKRLSDEQYPPDIKGMIFDTLEAQNPDDKTLYDIHFEKYKGIDDCYTLEELKERYPEFQDVVSAWQVSAAPDSFIGRFQNKESEIFTSEEDLTLQLIKLYWGRGFSLKGLSDYIEENSKDKTGIQLGYTMRKLNIPRMNNNYAHILKLSNKEYNEEFTSQMVIKRKEALEAKKQLAEGEAVVIPKGQLSEAHKQHISEGLKKHFQEHPEKIFAMSERQKRFYEENPQFRDEMTKINLYAFHQTEEGKSVLRGINRFMKKRYGIMITRDDIEQFNKITGKKKTGLEMFWDINKWACEKFSVAQKKARAYFKEHDELPPIQSDDKSFPKSSKPSKPSLKSFRTSLGPVVKPNVESGTKADIKADTKAAQPAVKPSPKPNTESIQPLAQSNNSSAPRKISMEERLNYVNIPGKQIIFSNLPTKVREDLNRWVIQKGYDPKDYVFALGVIRPIDDPGNPELEKKVNERSLKLITKYFNENMQVSDLVAQTYLISIAEVLEKLDNPSFKYTLPKSLRKDYIKARLIKEYTNSVLITKPIYRKTRDTIQYLGDIEQGYLNEIYQGMMRIAADLGCEDFPDYFQKIVDSNFDKCVKMTIRILS